MDFEQVGVYRPDIDGLRAVAVIPVILFHADVSAFRGGFIGVDVFFVISGYLITSIIASDALRGRFRILDFYERRIRRIFPALFVVMLAASMVAWKLLLPTELRQYGQSVVASTLFSSNILFWLQTGYFDKPADSKPLLHTWSLAVEEQYYLVYPLILVAIIKLFPKSFRPVFLGLAVLSFSLNLFLTRHHPDGAFFLTPGRMWEFALGALLALGWNLTLPSRALAELSSVMGIALIAVGVFAFGPDTPFPGYYALLPCVGTALLINAGTQPHVTVVNRLLSWSPLVTTGLLSYSLYLWHWPTIVFTRLYLQRPLFLYETIALLAIVFLASVLSWRYVETPVRRRKVFHQGPPLFAAAGVVMIAATAFGLAAHGTRGFPARVPEKVHAISKAIDEHRGYLPSGCMRTEQRADDGQFCEIGVSDREAGSFVLWGDSHARALVPAVANAAEAEGLSGIFAGHVGCPPLQGVVKSDRPTQSTKGSCREFNNSVLRHILSDSNIKTVILAARWTVNVEGVRLRTDPLYPSRIFLWDSDTDTVDTKNNASVAARGLNRTLDALTAAGREVVIVGPVPEAPVSVSPALARSVLMGLQRDIVVSSDRVNARLEKTITILESVTRRSGTRVIYPHAVLCDEVRCMVDVGGVPLYRDHHHLSALGALLVSERLADRGTRRSVFF